MAKSLSSHDQHQPKAHGFGDAEESDSLAGCHSANDSVITHSCVSQDCTCRYVQSPILVGYAFGKKKMATMGVVMAEASLAKLSAVISESSSSGVPSSEMDKSSNAAASAITLTHDALERNLSSVAFSGGDRMGCPNFENPNDTIVLSISGGPSGTGLRNVVRSFRSSCSSVATDDEDTLSIGSRGSTKTTVSATLTTRSTSSSSKQYAASGGAGNFLYPVRVSFVPLDLDSPLEEQHGGQFDVILHKMTEDILCLSTADPRWQRLLQEETGNEDSHDRPASMTETCPEGYGLQQVHDQNLHLSLRRIQRLNRYQANHPRCSLVDHPSNVQVVMSRSEISHLLAESLVGVSSKSGIPVRTPRFYELTSAPEDPDEGCRHHHGLRYPLIAKPLTAAGTKKSHCMGIVAHEAGLKHIEAPCLLQEYANHQTLLYKVYVLGTAVHVFTRSSLPDLPTTSVGLSALKPHLEFDSQRPYPTIRDFRMEDHTSSTTNEVLSTKNCLHSQMMRSERRERPNADEVHGLEQAEGDTNAMVQASELTNPCGESRCRGERDQLLEEQSSLSDLHPYPALNDYVNIPVDSANARCDAVKRVDDNYDSGEVLSFPKSVVGRIGNGDDQPLSRESTTSDVTVLPVKNVQKVESMSSSSRRTVLTEEELSPVVTALKQTFGLELFGFDVLVSQEDGRDEGDDDDLRNKNGNPVLLVVDVNYFPSYKEVANFPALLAKYLTQKAIQGRKMVLNNGR